MDDLDRILISDESVVPSEGFAAGVMDAVEAAAGEPPPFPFPWRLFATGLVGCALWAWSGVWLLDSVGQSAVGVVAKLSAVETPLEYAAGAIFGCLAGLAIQRTRTRVRAW
jgi:hypothetical protein